MGKKTKKNEAGSASAMVSHDDASEQEVDEALLQRQFRSCLSMLKKGDLYVSGIEETEFGNLLDGEGNPPSPDDKKHVFYRLLKVVAQTIVDDQKVQMGNSSGSSKKRRKLIQRQLWDRRDKWAKEIQNLDQSNDENNVAMKVEQQTGKNAVSPEDELGSNVAADEAASILKKKKKKKKKGGTKKKKKDKVASDDVIPMDVDVNVEALVDDEMNDVSKSKSTKKRKKLGSAKQKKKRKTEPVVEEPVVPKRTPSASKRRQKLKEQFEAEKERILSSLPKDLVSQFKQIGYATWQKTHLPVLYLGPYDVAPGTVRNQWMTMYKNTANRRHMMSRLVFWYGTENMECAYSFLPKSKCFTYEVGEAKGYGRIPQGIQRKVDEEKTLTSKERQLFYGLEEMKEDLEKDPKDRKRGPEFVEEHEMELSDEESVVFDQIDPEEIEEEIIEDVKDESPPVSKKKGHDKESGYVDELDFAEEEITSDEEDEEADIPESEDDDDERDLDYAPEGKSKKKPGKLKSDAKSSKPAKKPPKKAKLERKRTKKPTKISKKEAHKQEQMRFEECENDHLPMVERWRTSLEAKDVDKLMGAMTKLNVCVETFSAAFIEAYGLAQLMKETKPLLKGSEAHSTKYKEVWNKMKTTYAEKKDLKPPGFVPVMRSSKSETPKQSGNESPLRKTEEPRAVQSPEPPDIQPKTPEVKKENESEEPKNDTAETTSVVSPMRIPRTKESIEESLASPPMSRETSRSIISSPSQIASRPNQAKSEKKVFSLVNMLGSKPQAQQGTSTAEQPGRTSQTAKRDVGSADTPSWLTTVPDMDSLEMTGDRTFALDFFEQAAAQFPPEKVNSEAVSKSLEDAVFTWSKEKHRANWVEPYWEKVHALVGAISGKRKTGQIVNLILDGKYKTARELVLAPEETLRWSYGL